MLRWVAVKYFDWNDAKNAKLRAERGIGLVTQSDKTVRAVASNAQSWRYNVLSSPAELCCTPTDGA